LVNAAASLERERARWTNIGLAQGEIAFAARGFL
jgi:hypothetical protein